MESDGEFIMAVKYLSGNRIWGTNAERLAMTTGGATVEDDMTDSSLWTFTNASMSSGYIHVPTGANPPNLASRAVTLTDNYDEMCIDIDYKMENGQTDMTFCGVVSFLASGINPYGASTITNSNQTLTIGSTNTDRYNLWRGKESSGTTDHNQSFGGSPTPSTTLFYYRIIVDIPDITVKRYTSDANRTDDTGTIVTDTTTLDATKTAVYRACNKFSHFYTGCYSTSADNTYLYGFKIYENSTTPIATVYPNLPNGSVFITSDTNVHYMWNGTDTWNEVA